MSSQSSVVIRTHTSADIALRMDARKCGSKATPSGCGIVNCQYNPGPWEHFNIEEQPDGTVAIESAVFTGCYLRMDGGSGKVNCQYGVGAWEKYNLRQQADGTTAIESVQFPNHYLHIDTTGVTHFNPYGWINTVHCKTGISNTAKFEIESFDSKGGFNVRDLALSYNIYWSSTNPTIFKAAAMTIVNQTGSDFPKEDQTSWVSVEVYASNTNTVNDSMLKIGDVPANLGNLVVGGSINFRPSSWESNGLARFVTQNPQFPESGEYYIYVQVTNTDGTIDGSGTFSMATYQLPPIAR